MLTRDRTQEVFDRALKFSPADEIEVLVSGGRSALTRFANNTIHQNVSEENYVLSVRSVFSGRTARATTNQFDDESIRRVVEGSEALAKVQEPDPDLLPMPDASAFEPGQVVGRTFFETMTVGPQERAETV